MRPVHNAGREPDQDERSSEQCHSIHGQRRGIPIAPYRSLVENPLGGSWMEKGRSACAYEPIVRSDNPAAALTRNRLDAPNARDKVSAGYTNHAPRTLQDCLAIDDLTDDPIGDLSRFT